MLSKDEISDAIILERLYSAISRVSMCMRCRLSKLICLDVADNILLCKRCSKRSKWCKVVGTHKVSLDKVNLPERRIGGQSLEAEKRLGFSFRSLFSKYFGSG